MAPVCAVAHSVCVYMCMCLGVDVVHNVSVHIQNNGQAPLCPSPHLRPPQKMRLRWPHCLPSLRSFRDMPLLEDPSSQMGRVTMFR